MDIGAYLGFNLLEQCIVEPEEDISPPMPLFTARGYLSHSTLVHLSHTARSSFQLIGSCTFCFEVAPGLFLQPRIVEPNVVVATIVRQLLLVLNSALAQDGVLERASGTVLLLEFGVRGVQARRLGARYTFESKLIGFQNRNKLKWRRTYLVDDSCSVVLFLARLHLRKRTENGLSLLDLLLLISKELQRRLKDLTSLV